MKHHHAQADSALGGGKAKHLKKKGRNFARTTCGTYGLDQVDQVCGARSYWRLALSYALALVAALFLIVANCL